MRQVLKYSLMSEAVTLPYNAKVIHCGIQQQVALVPTIWADVDDLGDRYPEQEFVLLATGAEVPDFAQHIHTFMMPPSSMAQEVWHLFKLD